METSWQDYYKILQVHHTAEPEVIESAYKRLCRKFHPDICRSVHAEEKIKLINNAFEVLGNDEKRREYHITWLKYNRAPQIYGSRRDGSNPAGDGGIPGNRFEHQLSRMESYFHHITRREFDKAYGLISDHDRKHITKGDFVRWQEAVSRVFSIGSFECGIFKSLGNIACGGAEFEDALECSIKLVEKNVRSGRTYSDETVKYLVREGCFWNVFLGYESLRPLAERFESLAGTAGIPSVMEHLCDIKAGTDHVTGLPNRQGFLERMQPEEDRSRRYGRTFSVVCIKFKAASPGGDAFSKSNCDLVLFKIASIIRKSIRNTDIPGIWSSDEFMVMMPETGPDSAACAARKLCGSIGGAVLPAGAGIHCWAGVEQHRTGTTRDTASYAERKAILASKITGKPVISNIGKRSIYKGCPAYGR